jgi:hypothetical protein
LHANIVELILRAWPLTKATAAEAPRAPHFAGAINVANVLLADRQAFQTVDLPGESDARKTINKAFPNGRFPGREPAVRRRRGRRIASWIFK